MSLPHPTLGFSTFSGVYLSRHAALRRRSDLMPITVPINRKTDRLEFGSMIDISSEW